MTCPGFRYHPAVIAHAAATLGAMYPGRFWLGLGAGEALNEHVVGGDWPEIGVRSSMLFEAIEIIYKLFGGEVVRHRGEHFTLESAKLYTRPESRSRSTSRPPARSTRSGPAGWPTGSSRSGPPTRRSACSGAEFDEGAREAGKDPTAMPKLLQIHVSWAPTEEEAIDPRVSEWPNGGMPFPKQDIKNPEDFAAMAKLVRPEDFKNRVPDLVRSRGPHAHIQHYSTWASTRSTSTTSGATRPSSSTPSAARSCPS